jgi:chromosomal replication initiator protein
VAQGRQPALFPLFLVGDSGIGKSHLARAVVAEARRSSGVRAVYASAERFTTEFTSAIRARHGSEFRRRYRQECDLLVLDDVQFLAGKESTQDEFFHTFNALHENHKQIVLTADRKPHEISDVADRLRTRFAWGLLADIEPPELEVRLDVGSGHRSRGLQQHSCDRDGQKQGEAPLHGYSLVSSSERNNLRISRCLMSDNGSWTS